MTECIHNAVRRIPSPKPTQSIVSVWERVTEVNPRPDDLLMFHQSPRYSHLLWLSRPSHGPVILPIQLPVHDELILELEHPRVRGVEGCDAELGVAPWPAVHRQVRCRVDLLVVTSKGLEELAQRRGGKLDDGLLGGRMSREYGRGMLMSILC